jgi:hypothetical protein
MKSKGHYHGHPKSKAANNKREKILVMEGQRMGV